MCVILNSYKMSYIKSTFEKILYLGKIGQPKVIVHSICVAFYIWGLLPSIRFQYLLVLHRVVGIQSLSQKLQAQVSKYPRMGHQ